MSVGKATLSTAALAGGSHSITAVYSGDGTFATSTSAVLTQIVNKPATTTAVASSLNPSTAGQTVTFTATVTSASPGTLTGTVAFFDGATSLGTGTVTAGQATLSTSALAAGSHSITAVYSGDATFATSTSAVLTQTVNNSTKPATTATVASSLNPSATGQSVTFTATVTSASGTPTGTVTFLDGTTSLGTGTLSTGHATLSTTTLAAGSHSITASYQGDATFAASTSTVLTQTVNNPAADFTIGAASGSPTSITVKAGSPANYSLQIALPAGVAGPLNVTITCTGAPSKASCNGPAVPVNVTGAAPTIVSVTVTTTANAMLLPAPSSRPGNPVNLLPILGPLAILLLLFWMATNKRTARLGEGLAWPGKLAPAMPVLALFLAMAFVSG